MPEPKYNIGDHIVNDSIEWASIFPYYEQRGIGHIGVIIDRKIDDKEDSPLFGRWGYLVAFDIGKYCSKSEFQIRKDSRMLESSKAKLDELFRIEVRERKLNELL